MKRYVMLEDKVIIDISKSDKYKIHEDTLWHNSMLQGTIIKQSDNLLDLLEVGDCWETIDNEIYSIDNERELRHQRAFYKTKAIWKRNGNVMRRYEV